MEGRGKTEKSVLLLEVLQRGLPSNYFPAPECVLDRIKGWC